ncbi:MAG: SsrA-binding protein SmpB, partial [Sinomicrobium sp.]|nr:SsrA-binding protein SmpB [Sinomicrobium sp.]
KARFAYELLDRYTAGIVLTGTEIKSIRRNKAGIAESFCEFNDKGELFVINMYIEEYTHGTHYNHKPRRPRKLLLQRKELLKLQREIKNEGLTIVPLRLFINEKGLAKLDIALAKGKKLYDKRETIKDRDNKRNLDRIRKNYK